MFPTEETAQKLIWRTGSGEEVASVFFIEEIYTAVFVVKRNSFPVENRLSRYEGMWDVQEVSESPVSEYQVFLIRRRRNWNCFKSDLPKLISGWLD